MIDTESRNITIFQGNMKKLRSGVGRLKFYDVDGKVVELDQTFTAISTICYSTTFHLRSQTTSPELNHLPSSTLPMKPKLKSVISSNWNFECEPEELVLTGIIDVAASNNNKLK
jgi:hypothetical protein